MPPLFLKLSQRPLKPSEQLHWIGVSYGLTAPLHKFWKRLGYAPVYVRQTANDLTGEHTCIMLKSLESGRISRSEMQDDGVIVGKDTWLAEFCGDFKIRFLELLGYQLRAFSPILALSLVESADTISKSITSQKAPKLSNKTEVNRFYTPYDLKRLSSYSNNLLDYHVIQDLVPSLARQFFLNQLVSDESSMNLSAVQSSILCGMGLQKKLVEELEVELGLPVSQILALFGKSVKRCVGFFDSVVEKSVREEIEKPKEKDVDMEESNGEKRSLSDDEAWDPVSKTLVEELKEEEEHVMSSLKEKQREILDSMDLSQYVLFC